MRSLRFLTLLLAVSVILPSSVHALEGIGPRSAVTGVVLEVKITKQQAFSQEGAEIIMKARNGQRVTVIVTKETEIITEGRLSRKDLIPANINGGMLVRIRGWKLGSDSLTASLIVIENISLNPALSHNGILTSIGGGSITVLGVDGTSRTYSVTNETEVNLNYTLYGADALTLIGKQVLLTLNPNDSSLVRVLRINGDKPVERTPKPTTIDFGVRTID